MADYHEFKRQVWRAATIAVALAACLTFGILVLTSGDWLPGGIIVAASAVGLAHQVQLIRNLYRTAAAASPRTHQASK